MNFQLLAQVMINKARLFEIFKDDEKYKGNLRQCPVLSELIGMELTLKLLNVDFEYTFDSETNEVIAITINADGQEYIAV